MKIKHEDGNFDTYVNVSYPTDVFCQDNAELEEIKYDLGVKIGELLPEELVNICANFLVTNNQKLIQINIHIQPKSSEDESEETSDKDSTIRFMNKYD